MRTSYIPLVFLTSLGAFAFACGPSNGPGNGGGATGGESSSSSSGTTSSGGTEGGTPTPLLASMGGNHACASGPSGAVYCWGNHQYGQLGSAATADVYSPLAVSGLTGVVALSVGGMSSCALLSDGTVSCWGRNSLGELGLGTADDNDHPTPTTVPNLTDVAQIALGSNGDGEHACAVKKDGSVLCWGNNSAGQLGLGSSDYNPHPTPTAAGITGVKQMSLNINTSCAVKTDGTVWCWGDNENAELGEDPATSESCPGAGSNPPFPCETHPKQVAGVSGAAKVANGFFSTHVLLADGTVTGWGANEDGVLGTGSATFGPFPTPQPVPGLSGVVDLAAGGSAASDAVCAVKNDGTVWCWGSDRPYDQLAEDGANVAGEPSPKQVAGLTGSAVSLSMSVSVLVRMADGALWAWGANAAGQLGQGAQSGAEFTPATVMGLK